MWASSNLATWAWLVAGLTLAIVPGPRLALAQSSSLGSTALSSPAPEIRAQLTPRQFTTLSSELAASIQKISVKVGDRFEKGDVLVTFDCAVQRAQLARAESVLNRAGKTFSSDQRLLVLKSLGQLELDIAAADVQTARAEVAAAQAVASKCAIQAPFSGVVVDQKAREFQYTTPGQAVLDILDDRNLDIELIAPSRWLAWLKPGYALQVHIEETDKTYQAKVTRLGGRVDPVSQSIKVIAEIVGSPPELMAGMSGRASLEPPN